MINFIRIPETGNSPHISVSNEWFILDSINLPFKPEGKSECVGKPRVLNEIPGAHRQYIKGDGSCWARALWQNTFNQILNDPDEFDGFILKTVDSIEELQVPEILVKQTIHILYKLKNLSDEERINYLNHQNVDTALILFMRHVAGGFMEKNFTIYSANDIADIKTNIKRYGGPEITAFARHFNLAVHSISKVNGQWVYRAKEKNMNSNGNDIPVKDMNFNIENQVIMFGAKDDHYEVISFRSKAGQNQENDDRLIAQELQIKEWFLTMEQSGSGVEDFFKTLADDVQKVHSDEELAEKNRVEDEALLARKIQEQKLACVEYERLQEIKTHSDGHVEPAARSDLIKPEEAKPSIAEPQKEPTTPITQTTGSTPKELPIVKETSARKVDNNSKVEVIEKTIKKPAFTRMHKPIKHTKRIVFISALAGSIIAGSIAAAFAFVGSLPLLIGAGSVVGATLVGATGFALTAYIVHSIYYRLFSPKEKLIGN